METWSAPFQTSQTLRPNLVRVPFPPVRKTRAVFHHREPVRAHGSPKWHDRFHSWGWVRLRICSCHSPLGCGLVWAVRVVTRSHTHKAHVACDKCHQGRVCYTSASPLRSGLRAAIPYFSPPPLSALSLAGEASCCRAASSWPADGVQWENGQEGDAVLSGAGAQGQGRRVGGHQGARALPEGKGVS